MENGDESDSVPRCRPKGGAATGIPEEYQHLLRDALKRRGWSMAELARQIGASRSAVTKWLGGEGKPDKRYVPALSRHLGLPQMQLWRYYGQDAPDELPRWETMLLADIVTLPEGTTARELELALTQLQYAFPMLVLGARQWLEEERARAETQKHLVQMQMLEEERKRHAATPEAARRADETPAVPEVPHQEALR